MHHPKIRGQSGVGVLSLNAEDSIRLLRLLLRPDAEAIRQQQAHMAAIDQKLTIQTTANGYEVCVRSLDLSFVDADS